MHLIWTGPRRQAAILARILRKAGIEAVFMFAEQPEQGAVFVPDDDVDSPAIPRAIEQSEAELDEEGGSA